MFNPIVGRSDQVRLIPCQLAALALAAMLLSGCQLVLMPSDEPLIFEAGVGDQEPAASTDATQPTEAEPTEEVLEEANGSMAAETPETSESKIEEAPGPTDTATPEPVEEMAEAPTVEAMPEPGDPTVAVAVPVLNLRAGPGVNYAILGQAASGDTLPVTGQVEQCRWLQAEDPTAGAVWLSGSDQFVTLQGECADIAAVEPPAPPTSQPEPTAPPVAEDAPTPPPAPEPEPQLEDPFPPDQGCYLFQNQLGPELNITITARDWDFADNFQVRQDMDIPYCLAPGRYTITIDAPPPWSEVNDEIRVQAGDRILFPVRPRE